MDYQKYMTIAHTNHLLCSPLSPARLNQLISLLELEQGASVLDVGCSKAEMLIQMAEGCQIQAIGVDIAEEFIRAAQENIDNRVPGADISLHCMNIDDFEYDDETFDVIICIGSTHLYGGFEDALTTLYPLLRNGGYLIAGDVFWKAPPSTGYLKEVGIPAEALVHYPQHIYQAQAAAYTPLYALTSSPEEWDDYEWLTYRAIELYVRNHLEDIDVPEMMEKCRTDRDRYLKWGRDTMGFGLYLLQK
ncbi:MAG: class I SAM-dependent methyltransferase [Aggregatilineales bacterium]